MPFIDVKTNVTFSKEKADELMKELSGSLKAIGKSEAYVMCAVNDGLKMSFQGSSDEPAAIVEVKLLGKGTKTAMPKLPRISAILCRQTALRASVAMLSTMK